MKTAFSTSWVSSRQVRKQRKYRHNAPLHIKHTFLNAHLSKELHQKYGKRSLPLRKGDEVLVMRGSFAKKRAKVRSVSHATLKVYLEGIQKSKRDGTKYNVPFNARALQLVQLDTSDNKRIQVKTPSTPSGTK